MDEVVPGGPVGVGFVLIAVIAFVRFLLSDRTVAATHTQQINTLTRNVARLEEKIQMMDDELSMQRSLKHDMRGDLQKAVGPLYMIRDAHDFATVEVVKPLITRFLEDFEQKEAARRETERRFARPLPTRETPQ